MKGSEFVKGFTRDSSVASLVLIPQSLATKVPKRNPTPSANKIVTNRMSTNSVCGSSGRVGDDAGKISRNNLIQNLFSVKLTFVLFYFRCEGVIFTQVLLLYFFLLSVICLMIIGPSYC